MAEAAIRERRSVTARAARIAVPVFLAAFFLQSSLGIESESLTFDEEPAIGSAYLAFRTQDLRLVKERPARAGEAGAASEIRG
jgi:hypothetical protein